MNRQPAPDHVQRTSAEAVRLAAVLLVDDSGEDNFIHARQLRRGHPDCEVVIARDGQQGLDRLAARGESGLAPFDLIGLDVNMPVLDGYGFLRAYAELPEQQRARRLALMISTALPETGRDIAQRSGHVDFFLDKPFDMAALQRELDAPRD